MKSRSYHLATFGCQMNVYDSNLIAKILEDKGLTEASEMGKADVVIVNTCSIRGGAEDRAYARIASMRHFKRLNPEIKIAVVGCMAQNHGEKIPVELEHVDLVAGPDNYTKIADLLLGDKFGDKKNHKTPVLTDQDAFENYQGLHAKLSSTVTSLITIMRGCNKRCTYCIVPTVRGVERSREKDDILGEAKLAVAQGVKEICLLGQTVNSYRTASDSFASLLIALNEIPELQRIRFTSPHPRHFDSETISTMAKCEKVSSHVHLPLQSGSNPILKKMRRQYTVERYLEIVEELREKMPGLGITTDLIAGYPGESEEDFAATLDMIRKIRFDSAFLFAYSPREGTPAFDEKELLTEEEKQGRLEQMIAEQMQITEQKLDEKVGTEQEILIEEFSPRSQREWIGKSSCFKKVIVPGAPGIEKGSLVKVKIMERKGTVLRGIPS